MLVVSRSTLSAQTVLPGKAMTRIDRYLVFLYLRVLLICFLSVSGLLIVVHVFSNLDEFLRYAELGGNSVPFVLVDYYGPYMISIFEQLSGLLALLAMLFVIAWLNKTNEFTALLASGIPKRRVVRTLLIASAGVILLAVAMREFAVPAFQDRLDRNPQDLTGELPRPMRPTYDPRSFSLIQGKHLLPIRYQIVRPQLKVQGGQLAMLVGKKVAAASAINISPDRPFPDGVPEQLADLEGYYFQGVTIPKNIGSLKSVYSEKDESPILLTAADHPWLASDCCFLASDVEFETLRGGNAWKQFASTADLVTHLKAERGRRSNSLRVQIHGRFLRPFVDWTVLLLGIPVLLSRPDRHMFWVAGVCLALVAGFTGVVMASAAMGNSGYLLSPALSVWLPVIVFLPWAFAKTMVSFET